MNKLIIGNLKKNSIGKNYIDILSKVKSDNKIIILPNEVDLYKYDFSRINVGTQNIIDDKFEYILLGHKDVRYREDDILINSKIKECLKKGINIILCVNSIDTLKKDMKDIKNFTKIIIAYEEDKCIGTSQILTKSKIKSFIKEVKTLTDSRIRIIYGGGINKENISIIKEIKELDGVLIGNQCIDVNNFISIINEY